MRSEFFSYIYLQGADFGLDCVFPGKYEKIKGREKIVEHVCRGVIMIHCIIWTVVGFRHDMHCWEECAFPWLSIINASAPEILLFLIGKNITLCFVKDGVPYSPVFTVYMSQSLVSYHLFMIIINVSIIYIVYFPTALRDSKRWEAVCFTF